MDIRAHCIVEIVEIFTEDASSKYNKNSADQKTDCTITVENLNNLPERLDSETTLTHSECTTRCVKFGVYYSVCKYLNSDDGASYYG